MNEPTMETLARRLLGRSTAREGVLIFSTAKRVLSLPCIDRSVNYNQHSTYPCSFGFATSLA